MINTRRAAPKNDGPFDGGPTLSAFCRALVPCLRIACARAGRDGPEIVPLPSGEVPGTTRLRITYQGGIVEPLERSPLDLRGSVLSGSDWITIRDGVAVFETRLTLGTRIEDVVANADDPANERARRDRPRSTAADFLLGARMSGIAPMAAANGRVIDGAYRIALPIAFEGAGRVEKWAKPLLRQRSDAYPRYRLLLQSQCFAIGAIVIADGTVGAVDLEVWAFGPDPTRAP